MPKFICSGAKLKCMMGDSDSELIVLHPIELVYLHGELMANIMDHKSLINIKSFGKCKSMLNPVVAAATAANNGVLKPMPCVPNTPAPWVKGKTNVKVKGQPALMDDSKLQCIWGGAIEITDDGQAD